MNVTSDQPEFVFPTGSPEPEAATPWRAEWMRRAEDLCLRLAVPLYHRAEVRLVQGPVLQGRLCLDEEQLWPDGDRHRLALRIGRATFHLGEIESVVRLDDVVDEVNAPQKPPVSPKT